MPDPNRKVPPKTSQTHPLFINSVNVPWTDGKIGLTFCPGKKGPSLYGGDWDRDLSTDLAAVERWGADVLVTLLEDHEFSLLGVDEFPPLVQEFSFEWVHLPIVDVGVPDERFSQGWNVEGDRLLQILMQGGKIVLHCRGGLGRTGMIAARILVELGMEPQDAIELIRTARPGSIETQEQERYVLQKSWQSHRQTLNHFVGCLLGGAVGDALGAAVEFDSIEDIQKKFGPLGIVDFEPAYGRLGVITDDTQMGLFTAEGLLQAHCKRKTIGGVAEYAESVYQAYLRWLKTQDLSPIRSDCQVDLNSWLFEVPELHHRRSPGGTCIESLSSGKMGTFQKLLNNSKGCGGVMRAAPVGLFFASPGLEIPQGEREELAFKVGCEICAITHSHPTGWLAGGALALIVCRLVLGDSLPKAISKSRTHLECWPNHEECLAAIDMAVRLWEDKTVQPSPLAVARLGEGWIAEEALSIGLYCALVGQKNFAYGVRLAVNHSGDSDSTGSIAGNILGVLHGKGGLPIHWLRHLELVNVIEEVAGDLWGVFLPGGTWNQKYGS